MKKNEYEKSLARQAYGEATDEMVDMNSPELWMMLNEVQDIKRIGNEICKN